MLSRGNQLEIRLKRLFERPRPLHELTAERVDGLSAVAAAEVIPAPPAAFEAKLRAAVVEIAAEDQGHAVIEPIVFDDHAERVSRIGLHDREEVVVGHRPERLIGASRHRHFGGIGLFGHHCLSCRGTDGSVSNIENTVTRYDEDYE